MVAGRHKRKRADLPRNSQSRWACSRVSWHGDAHMYRPAYPSWVRSQLLASRAKLGHLPRCLFTPTPRLPTFSPFCSNPPRSTACTTWPRYVDEHRTEPRSPTAARPLKTAATGAGAISEVSSSGHCQAGGATPTNRALRTSRISQKCVEHRHEGFHSDRVSTAPRPAPVSGVCETRGVRCAAYQRTEKRLVRNGPCCFPTSSGLAIAS